MNKAAARVLLVYGYEPSGHSAAAFALEEAGRAAGLSMSRVEIAGEHHPAAGLAVARGYHALLRAAPGVWGALYRSQWVRRVLRAARGAYLAAGGTGRLRAGVRRSGADVVVCTQAAVAAVLAAARRRGDLEVPVVSVLTDYGAHPFWADPPADVLIAPTPAVADELKKLGVSGERVRVRGVPIHPVFSAPPTRAQARAALALPSSAPVVLLSGGGKGLGALDRSAAAILNLNLGAIALVLCGNNDRLRAALSSRRDSGRRLRVFGPQPPAFVAALLAAADVHVGKPGGLTSAESMALGVPMILTRPLPGQEESNARHLLSAGAAVFGGDPEGCARRIRALLVDRTVLAALAANAARAGRPDASNAAMMEVSTLIISPGPMSPK